MVICVFLLMCWELLRTLLWLLNSFLEWRREIRWNARFPISGSRNQFAASAIESREQSWRGIIDDATIDASPLGSRSGSSRRRQEASYHVITDKRSERRYWFQKRAVSQPNESAADDPIGEVMAGSPGSIGEFPSLDEILARLREIIEERYQIPSADATEQQPLPLIGQSPIVGEESGRRPLPGSIPPKH